MNKDSIKTEINVINTKQNESYQQKLEWHANRVLAKANYLIHTDSIKNNIVPTLTEEQKRYVYAE